MSDTRAGLGMTLPCSACGDGTCDEHASFKGFARLRRERDAAIARAEAAEAVMRACCTKDQHGGCESCRPCLEHSRAMWHLLPENADAAKVAK